MSEENPNVVTKFFKSRSFERGLRTIGGMLIAAFAPQIPVFLDLITATIPPQHSVWAGALISMVLKDLRMRYPDNSLLKYFPA